MWKQCGITREGRLTLKAREVQPITVPPIDADMVRETREALNMSRHVFAFKLGVNPRTLERWEQGRSKPNEQAAALIRLVRKYPRHSEEAGVAGSVSLSLRVGGATACLTVADIAVSRPSNHHLSCAWLWPRGVARRPRETRFHGVQPTCRFPGRGQCSCCSRRPVPARGRQPDRSHGFQRSVS